MKRFFSKMGLAACALTALVLAPAGLGAQTVNSFEYHGYARSGVMFASGFNTPGGQVDESWLGRLGNEDSQNYVETELVNKTVTEDGSFAKFHVMFALNDDNQFGSYTSLGGSNGDIAFRQAYVELGGYGWDPKAIYWVGQKYNGRDDIHILDQFWRDYSGQGLGVLNALDGKIDLSLVAVNNEPGKTSDGLTGRDFTTDLRVRFIPGLELEGALSYAPNNDQLQTKSDKSTVTGNTDIGYTVAAVYSFDKFFYVANGYSRAVLQYGAGLNSNPWTLGNSAVQLDDQKDAYAFRAIVFGEASDILPNLDLMPVIKYELQDDKVSGTDPVAKFGIALRPDYKISKNVSIQVEGAFAHTFVTAGSVPDWHTFANGVTDSGNDYKFTVAPTLSLDSGFWGRPQLRLFATYVGGDKAVIGNIDNEGKNTSEVRFGAQCETWF